MPSHSLSLLCWLLMISAKPHVPGCCHPSKTKDKGLNVLLLIGTGRDISWKDHVRHRYAKCVLNVNYTSGTEAGRGKPGPRMWTLTSKTGNSLSDHNVLQRL